MIELQYLTGMRSGEMTQMTTGQIDRSGAVWTYEPVKHKTKHLGHKHVVYLQKRAQAVVTPFLRLDPDAILFSPAEAFADKLAERAANRKTPARTPHPTRRAKNVKKRQPRERYTTESYCRAVARACERAFPPPADLKGDDLERWTDAHHIHPHQLRHTASTRFRREANIETARVLLGQKTLKAAEIYAEIYAERARKFMEAAG